VHQRICYSSTKQNRIPNFHRKILWSSPRQIFRNKGNIDTKRVFESVKGNKDVPLVMLPLIFVGTVITHLLGGSAGREGAALQLGGSMGYNVGKALKQDKESLKLIVTAGMSSVFAALFGTPLAATVFSLEVTELGIRNFRGLLIGAISSVTAFAVADFAGVEAVRFDMPEISGFKADVLLKVVGLAVLFALVCILFAVVLRSTERFAKKYIPNQYIRAAVGGLLIVFLTVILKTTDYNGAGMSVIERAIAGEAASFAFILKIVFTAITIAAGFKGGQIVPTFFIGATFGCFAGSLLGLDAGFCAALGLIAMFSGMTKCPVAAFLLATEVFGAKSVLFFAIVVVIAFICSGRFGLYDNAKKFKFEV
jgi:H+/Cl- antiporter ClcA